MSRSYKKSIICKQRNCQCMKKLANKIARRTDDLQNRSAYKKLLCSWDICDWKFRSTLKEFREHVYDYFKSRYPDDTEERLMKKIDNYYDKSYRRK